MPVFLHLLFLIAFWGGLFAVWALVSTAVVCTLRLKPKRTTFLLLLALYPVFLIAGFLYLTHPAHVFERELGFRPPRDVTALQSSFWQLGDYRVTHLRFQADPATIERIAARGLAPRNLDKFFEFLADNHPPAWWQPGSVPGTVAYAGHFHKGRALASENEDLVYDPATRVAHYRVVGSE